MKFVEQNNNERHTANAEDHDDGVDDGLPDGRRGVGGGVFEDHVDTRGSWKRELNTFSVWEAWPITSARAYPLLTSIPAAPKRIS